MNHTELLPVLALHAKWLVGEPDGECADLRGADLIGANLRYADLRGANLRGADLGDADLRGANLRGTNLGGANLRYADLGGANLRGAYLRGVYLRGAYLRGANLRGANLGDVTWSTYLSEVVPALLTAGGKTLAEVATPETWACHAWRAFVVTCPIGTAFDCDSLFGVPALYRQQAERFIQFFDAGLIPLPETEDEEIHREASE